MDRVYTAREVSELSGVDVQSVRTWGSRGWVDAEVAKVNGRVSWVFDADSMDTHLAVRDGSVDLTEAARTLGVTRATVHAWLAEERLESVVWINGRRRVTLASINRILEEE